MKRLWLLLPVALLVSAACLPTLYANYRIKTENPMENLFFGVSFGLNTTSEAKLLIDKVKGYTNLFLINSWSITTNETALNEVCDYAAKSNLKFMVFFDFVSRVEYPWHQTWLDTAKHRWGEDFLGVYLFDEPGGKQIDKGQWRDGEYARNAFLNVSDYSDAANRYVNSISSINSTVDVKKRSIPLSTSDYALYWFDYLAGYDTLFAEVGWNHSLTQHVALCRGAANVQNKEWGVIITWTYNNPPYMEDGAKMLQDMTTAYRAGAKYIIVFNYPRIGNNPYGILTEDHFAAMETFWNQVHSSPRNGLGELGADVALVLPKDYGWGMRTPDDKIWGFWQPDSLSPLIWNKMTRLMEIYGLRLDIIYEDARFNFEEKYSKIYFWNSTVD